MKRNKFFILLLVVLPSTVFCRTREDVITDAESYSQYLWKPETRNLLDEKHCDVAASTTTYPDRMVPGRNDIDDRREFYNTKTERCETSSSHWPFEVCSTCTYSGEAYAYGFGDHLSPELKNPMSTYSRKSFQEYLSKGLIAGARPIDSDADSNDSVDDTAWGRFTGIDCSGFITRAMKFKGYHYSTVQLLDYAMSVSPDRLKAGDILDKISKPRHVVLFAGWINKPNTARIIHASLKNFSKDKYEYHVSEDTATITGTAVSKTLKARPVDGYYP